MRNSIFYTAQKYFSYNIALAANFFNRCQREILRNEVPFFYLDNTLFLCYINQNKAIEIRNDNEKQTYPADYGT